MATFNKGDKVKIINTGDIWEGKTGKVVSVSTNEIITKDDEDLTEVTVLVDFNEDKTVLQIFPKQNLKLDTVNESKLTEEFINAKTFKEGFVGEEVIFKGYDYSELYPLQKVGKDDYDFADYDKEEIEKFKSVTDKQGIIVKCDNCDYYEKYEDTDRNFENAYWTVWFEDQDIVLPWVSGKYLNLIDKQKLTESLSEKKGDENDFIHDYVYLLDLDENEVHSWEFANKIANIEKIDVITVLEKAHNLKYKTYHLEGSTYDKYIILAPETKIEDVKEEYIDYIPGNILITEVK